MVAGCASPSPGDARTAGRSSASPQSEGVVGSTSDQVLAFEVDGEIFIADGDGEGRTNVTQGQVAGAAEPQWSPDGQQLVFICTFGEQEEIQEICTINREGSDLVRLTDNDRPEFSPDWSPSGQRIAFIRILDQGGSIFTMRADGSDQRRVPNTSNSGHLAWRYNRRIVFTGGSADGGDIYTILPSGEGRRRLTRPHDGEEDEPQWSPHGRSIVYMRTTGVGNFDIFKMHRDGSRVRRLTRRCCSASGPTWSANGKKILFLHFGLFRMNADGSNEARVPNGRAAGPVDATVSDDP